jgi:hypothetical protein
MAERVCSGCGKPVNNEATEKRQPCSHCGDLARTANVSVHATVRAEVHLLTKAKHRDGGKKVVREVTEGDSFYQKTRTWSLMRRVIDWKSNWYDEIFKDKVTDQVIHSCSEPLSEHWGHGSDRKRRTQSDAPTCPIFATAAGASSTSA